MTALSHWTTVNSNAGQRITAGCSLLLHWGELMDISMLSPIYFLFSSIPLYPKNPSFPPSNPSLCHTLSHSLSHSLTLADGSSSAGLGEAIALAHGAAEADINEALGGGREGRPARQQHPGLPPQ